MLAPAQKNFSPAPRKTTTWTAASIRASSTAASISCIISYEYVLAGGSFSSITQMPSAISRLIFDTRLDFRPHVLEMDRCALDAPLRRRDVIGERAGLVHGLRHDAEQVLAIERGRQPLAPAAFPLCVAELVAFWIEVERREHADAAVELAIRQAQAIREAVALENLVPPGDAALAVADVPVAQDFVHRR